MDGEAGDPDDIGSEDVDLERATMAERDRASLARAKRRAHFYLRPQKVGDFAILLEELAVRPRTSAGATYAFHLTALLDMFPVRSPCGLTDDLVDSLIIARLDFQFKLGLELSSGEKTDSFIPQQVSTVWQMRILAHPANRCWPGGRWHQPRAGIRRPGSSSQL